MTRDIGKRLQQLKARRSGTDRVAILNSTDGLDVLAKSIYGESYTRRAAGQKHTQYVLGAMQPVDGVYTRISLAEAERVGKQLDAGLRARGRDVGFRLQGSVPCDIHIRGVSDVDLLVLDEAFFTYDTSGSRARAGQFKSPVAYTPLSALQSLRSGAESILKDKFPQAKVDTSGAKAIKLSGGSLRRPVDVVPSHWHDTSDYQVTWREADRGVKILDKSISESVLNMPFRHIERIDQRDAQARSGLKKAIRLLKNVKADAIEEGTRIPLSSFDVASAMWHADIGALAAGEIHDLAIVAEATRHLDHLARNTSIARTLLVPDGSRPVFDSPEKIEALIQLSLEMDDVALQVAREQQRALQQLEPSMRQIEEALRRAVVPG
ncbi:MAG: hypothetical protein IOD09_08085 [Rhodocyclaceae bacterium]|nr:hypothetical protein [Rhodocyclaceae bacterium]